jgi:hypothetical protein
MSSAEAGAGAQPGAARFPLPVEGILLAHFIVSDDVERSRRFYTDVLGGETVGAGDPTYVALATSCIIINVGGGPTRTNRPSASKPRVSSIE